jgi:hypothetical protein
MQSHWAHEVPYYRCRFPAEYALANRVQHPLNINLRQDEVIGHVDKWLAREFAPHRMKETLRALAEAHEPEAPRKNKEDGTAAKIAECDRKLAQYRAALDAGANPATVAAWIAETEAEKATYALVTRRPDAPRPRPRMTEQEIRAVVDKLADIARILSEADPNDKSEIFRKLGLKLTYHPGRRIVEAKIEPAPLGFFESVRGRTGPMRTCPDESGAIGGGLDAAVDVPPDTWLCDYHAPLVFLRPNPDSSLRSGPAGVR